MPAATLILHHHAGLPSRGGGDPDAVVHHTSVEAGDLRPHSARAGFGVKAA